MKFKFSPFILVLLAVACASNTTDKTANKSVSRTYNSNRASQYPHEVKSSSEQQGIAQTIDDYRNDEEDADDQLFAEDSYLPYLHTSVPEDRNTRGHIYGSSSSDSLQNGKTDKKVYFLYGAEHLNLQNYYFDIPVVYNDQVKKWMNYFLGRGKEYFIRYSERAGRYAPTLGKILEENGLPRDLIFLAMAESGFQNNAKSWAKAVGPWQFMPYTGRRYGLKIDWFVDERRDPIKATIAAAKYLGDLYQMFGSWELAAAGYNAGEGKIGRAIKKYRTEDFWHLTRGRYLKPETKNYVPKIMALAIIGKNLEAFGLSEIAFHEPLDFEEIDLKPNSDIYDISAALGIEIDEVQRLNPELSRWQTPMNVKNYKLRVPVGKRVAWNECCKEQDYSATRFQQYAANKKISLDKVAKSFRLRPQLLAALNGLNPQTTLGKGDVIKLPFRDDHTIRDEMYADLYEKSSRSRRSLKFRKKLYGFKKKESVRRLVGSEKGSLVKSNGKVYVVKTGDTLYQISRKTGVPVRKLKKSNLALLGSRGIQAGDKLQIK